MNLFPPDFYDATVRFIKAEKDGHEGRLACAVLPEEGVNLPLLYPETNLVVGYYTGENLGNVQHFYGRLRHNPLLKASYYISASRKKIALKLPGSLSAIEPKVRRT